MSVPHPTELSDPALLEQCTLRFGRKSGPGGQHRNKVETAVVIEHRPTGVRGEAGERRSQLENRKLALARLRINLALSQRRIDRVLPSEVWRRQVTPSGKLRIGQSHPEFAVIASDLLDALGRHEQLLRGAAGDLGISSGQLIRMLQIHPRVWQHVNAERALLGLHPLTAG